VIEVIVSRRYRKNPAGYFKGKPQERERSMIRILGQQVPVKVRDPKTLDEITRQSAKEGHSGWRESNKGGD